VVSGWWFVRNVFLYRDLLGSTTQGGGPSFPAFGFHGPGTIGHALEEVVTYLWVPTEYYRDLIKAPVVLKGILVVLTIVIVVLAATTLAKRSREKLRDSISVAGYVELESAWLVVGFTAVVAVASWVVLFICSSAIAPRLAYAAIPCWLGLIALGANQVSDRLPHRLSPFLPLCVGVTLLALDGWELVLAHRLPLGVFHIILR
jgi:D-alanyl-D-alanine carboxypeptidase (penicillin-binding protein 5/6)